MGRLKISKVSLYEAVVRKESLLVTIMWGDVYCVFSGQVSHDVSRGISMGCVSLRYSPRPNGLYVLLSSSRQ